MSLRISFVISALTRLELLPSRLQRWNSCLYRCKPDLQGLVSSFLGKDSRSQIAWPILFTTVFLNTARDQSICFKQNYYFPGYNNEIVVYIVASQIYGVLLVHFWERIPEVRSPGPSFLQLSFWILHVTSLFDITRQYICLWTLGHWLMTILVTNPVIVFRTKVMRQQHIILYISNNIIVMYLLSSICITTFDCEWHWDRLIFLCLSCDRQTIGKLTPSTKSEHTSVWPHCTADWLLAQALLDWSIKVHN